MWDISDYEPLGKLWREQRLQIGHDVGDRAQNKLVG